MEIFMLAFHIKLTTKTATKLNIRNAVQQDFQLYSKIEQDHKNTTDCFRLDTTDC